MSCPSKLELFIGFPAWQIDPLQLPLQLSSSSSFPYSHSYSCRKHFVGREDLLLLPCYHSLYIENAMVQNELQMIVVLYSLVQRTPCNAVHTSLVCQNLESWIIPIGLDNLKPGTRLFGITFWKRFLTPDSIQWIVIIIQGNHLSEAIHTPMTLLGKAPMFSFTM